MTLITHREYAYADVVLRRVAREDKPADARALIAAAFAEYREELLAPLERLLVNRCAEIPKKVVATTAIAAALARAQGLVQCDACDGWVEPSSLVLTGCRACWQDHAARKGERER